MEADHVDLQPGIELRQREQRFDEGIAPAAAVDGDHRTGGHVPGDQQNTHSFAAIR